MSSRAVSESSSGQARQLEEVTQAHQELRARHAAGEQDWELVELVGLVAKHSGLANLAGLAAAFTAL